ncbi:hypothetical protein EON65_29400 [archaeon]|nr:MAG: hypothetical protein EON65_29400 [archaeon]
MKDPKPNPYAFKSTHTYTHTHTHSNRQVTSAFGKLWDPVADKLTVTTILILLCAQYPTLVYVMPVLVILIREITISALREQMAAQNVQIPVGSYSHTQT